MLAYIYSTFKLWCCATALLLGSGFLILVVVYGVINPRAKELSKAVKKKRLCMPMSLGMNLKIFFLIINHYL